MSRNKKNKLPFDSRGGVVVISRRMLSHPNYLNLMPQAKVLITMLQSLWRNDKPVDFGIREASEKIPCDRRTAMKAFKQLIERGFIVCVEESFFSSRTERRTRSWRLEWMPFNDQKPRNTWENV